MHWEAKGNNLNNIYLTPPNTMQQSHFKGKTGKETWSGKIKITGDSERHRTWLAEFFMQDKDGSHLILDASFWAV